MSAAYDGVRAFVMATSIMWILIMALYAIGADDDDDDPPGVHTYD